MPRSLLFCNVGWMSDYQGQTDDDKIIGGGRYVQIEKRGHEVCNFVASAGMVYGYVQPVGGRILIKKLGAPKKSESIDGIDVVITARRPGGDTVVVGWYGDATVYENIQPLSKPTATHKKNGVDSFRFSAKATNARLLPPEQRTLIVPRGKGGIGQSNVWYAQNASPTWLAQVRHLIETGSPAKPKHGKRPKPDHFRNALVEDAAMMYVWAHYEERGYVLDDVSKQNLGWDLEAVSGKLTLRIEVKGLSGKSPNIELTPNEYKAFVEKSHTYRLCIVSNALAVPSLATCFFNLASGQWAVESAESSQKVKITEHVAATVAVA